MKKVSIGEYRGWQEIYYSTPKRFAGIGDLANVLLIVSSYRFPVERRMASMAPWRELLQNAMHSHKHLRHSTHLQLVCHVFFSDRDCLFLWVCYEAWLRYPGVVLRLLSSIGLLYLIGALLGEDQRTNIIKTHHVYKRLDYDFKFYYLPSAFNSEHDWEDLCIQLKNQKRCTTDKLNRIMVQYPIRFWWCFIIDLLMQHNFRCVNLIGRRWSTWKTDWLIPTFFIVVLRIVAATNDGKERALLVKYMGLMRSLCSVGHLYFRGIWQGL